MTESLEDCQVAEAHELADIMQVVIRIGVLMLQAGTVSFRVEQAMQRVAIALGADRLDAYVTLTGITASIHRQNQHYTQIARVTSVGVDMSRLSAVEFLTFHVPRRTTPQAVCQWLDAIEKRAPVYPLPVTLIAVAVACGAFAVIQGGTWVEFGAAAVGAIAGQVVRIYLRAIALNLIPLTVVCAAIATLFCHFTLECLAALGHPTATAQFGLLASVLFLVPGAPLITAALDLIRFDLISGISRITYAVLLLLSLALGILFAGLLADVTVL